MENKKILASELSAKLWQMANELRGTMEASEFKNYILGLIFYKFLSDKVIKHFTEQLEVDGISYQEAWDDEEFHDDVVAESIERLGYVLEPKYLFSNIIKMIEKNEFSIEYLEEGINSIVESTQGQESEDDFVGLFEDMDLKASRLGKIVSERSKAIGKIMQTIDTIEVDYDTTNADVLGEAYIELISKFASTAGKKAGEFFTMISPSRLVARLATVGLKEAKNAFDPACGSGSLLLQVGQYCKVHKYYGQELTQSTYNLARMNMMLHGIDFKNFDIVNCNTITDDEALGENQYTIQVANPPYSVKWTPDPSLIEDERFAPYGVLAPKSYADLMFVEHMIYHMDDDGRIAVLLPHGVLFRGGAEQKIRTYMIESQNYLDAVIGLPAGMFTTTGIAVACLVFKKQRNGNSDNICFIDASKDFETEGKINILTDEIIDKIVNTYVERKDVDKYCHIASIEKEIKENDFNLNIPRYVDTFEEEEPVDIQAEKEKLVEITKRKQEALDKVNSMMKLLGL